jgi:hypothetical protein
MCESSTEADEDGDEEGWAARFAALVTGTYAQLQTRAAEKCGVAPGEAWRTALEAAAGAGVRQVSRLSLTLASPYIAQGVFCVCCLLRGC